MDGVSLCAMLVSLLIHAVLVFCFAQYKASTVNSMSAGTSGLAVAGRVGQSVVRQHTFEIIWLQTPMNDLSSPFQTLTMQQKTLPRRQPGSLRAADKTTIAATTVVAVAALVTADGTGANVLDPAGRTDFLKDMSVMSEGDGSSSGMYGDTAKKKHEASTLHDQEAQPDYAHNPSPHYPVLMREHGIGGVVWLRVFVDKDGRPELINLNKSSGYRLLDNAALLAVKQWRFVPAKKRGQHHAAWVEFSVRFALHE